MFEQKTNSKEKKINFFIMPLKKKISTHLKAPIAHKT